LREERRLRVLEKRVLRRIFGTKRDEVTGVLNDLYSSLNTVRAIKSSGIRWAGYVARMGERREVGKVGGET
jgi:hypothetical protein